MTINRFDTIPLPLISQLLLFFFRPNPTKPYAQTRRVHWVLKYEFLWGYLIFKITRNYVLPITMCRYRKCLCITHYLLSNGNKNIWLEKPICTQNWSTIQNYYIKLIVKETTKKNGRFPNGRSWDYSSSSVRDLKI